MSQQTEDKASDTGKRAELYRMVMENHLCPFGLKSRWLLRRNGFEIVDHHLSSRQETDAFLAEHNVSTTPQTFINGQRVGGYEALRQHFTDYDPDSDETSYTPVLMIFAVCALMAIALASSTTASVASLRTLEWFAAFAMCALALQKLQDIESFSTMFLNYDLLAQRWVPYAYLYAFGEAAAGVLMVGGGTLAVAGAPIALFIGSIGAFSVFKAVYIDRRELKCACVGGNSRVPLGFVSLSENLVMMAMGIWMPLSRL